MITNEALDEQRQRETSSSESSTSLQAAVPVSNQIVRVSSLSSSDESSTSEDEDNGKQVTVVGPQALAEILPQALAENESRINNTFNDCSNVTSMVNNTTVFKEGVTVNHNIYCCPASLDYALKTKRGLFIFVASLVGVFLTIFLSLWIPNLKTLKQPNASETEISSSSTHTSTEVLLSSSTDSSSSTSENAIVELKLMSREDWKAAPAKRPPVKLAVLPPIYIIFSETETDSCTTTPKCVEMVRNIQTIQMQDNGQDIGYNFLLGGDGFVYEGRGWDVEADHVYISSVDYDDNSIDVSFIGNYHIDNATDGQLQAAITLIQYGVQNGKLDVDYRLKARKQLTMTDDNPGRNLYDIISNWKNWDEETLEVMPLLVESFL